VSRAFILKRNNMVRFVLVAALIVAAIGVLFLMPRRESYAASKDAGTKIVVIPIEGMTCASCVARVKSTLKALDGVVDVQVDLEHRSAQVRYVEARVSPGHLINSINKLGYKTGIPKVEGAP
jgi:copper chaperone CopZ